MKNKKLWFMRIDLWKPCLKTGGSNFVRHGDPENHLTGFFSKFWKPGWLP